MPTTEPRPWNLRESYLFDRTVIAEIQPTGILIDGAVGAIELGPVSFDDARLRLALLPEPSRLSLATPSKWKPATVAS